MYFHVTCPKCGAEDTEIVIDIISVGHPGNYFEPGEGAEWSLAEGGDDCSECGYVFSPDEISASYEYPIQEKIAESKWDTYE
jgi:hypothetical protein